MAGKSKNRKRWDAVTTVAYPLLFAVLLIAAWQTKLLHRLLHVDTFILPIPTRILTIIQENWGAIAENLQSTVIVIVIGLAAGSLLGYLIALVAAAFPHWGAGGLTIVSCFNAVPVVALAPVIINWTRDVSNDVAFRSMVAKCIVVMILYRNHEHQRIPGLDGSETLFGRSDAFLCSQSVYSFLETAAAQQCSLYFHCAARQRAAGSYHRSGQRIFCRVYYWCR